MVFDEDDIPDVSENEFKVSVAVWVMIVILSMFYAQNDITTAYLMFFLVAVASINLFFKYSALKRDDNRVGGIIVPGGEYSSSAGGTLQLIGLFVGVAIALFASYLASQNFAGSASVLIPFLGSTVLPAGVAFFTSFLMVFVLVPEIEEDLFGWLGFTFFHGYKGSTGLRWVIIVALIGIFGFVHLSTALKLQDIFGIDFGKNLFTVILLRIGCTTGALITGSLGIAKGIHRGFNLSGLIAMVR